MISNVNGHYAPILLLNSERLSYLPNVSDHCSPIHQDYIQVHKAGDRILLFRLCEKISVNSKTVIKNDIWEWLE